MNILKQDKWRGVVIVNSFKYMDKYLGILENDQYVKINYDPVKRIESKI